MKTLILVLLLFLTPIVSATQTWIVLGDSIMSSVAQGKASDHALHLVAAEKDVIFKNIASPAHVIGAKGYTGYNNSNTAAILKNIGGAFGYYDGVIIQAGTNDFGRSIAWQDTVAGLRLILNEARRANKKALLMPALWRSNESTQNSIGETLNTYRFFMITVCLQEFNDVCAAANLSNTILGTSAGALHYDANEIAAGNQLHPNVQGHRFLADWIKLEAANAGYF